MVVRYPILVLRWCSSYPVTKSILPSVSSKEINCSILLLILFLDQRNSSSVMPLKLLIRARESPWAMAVTGYVFVCICFGFISGERDRFLYIHAFFISDTFFQLSLSQCCLTFSWIGLEMSLFVTISFFCFATCRAKRLQSIFLSTFFI